MNLFSTTRKLGALFFAASLMAAPLAQVSAQEPVRTTVTSETLEMQGTDDRNFFYFRNDVEVRGTNLEIRCDELTVIAGRAGGGDDAVGEIGAIESILAVGNVIIHQAGRTAYAGRAEVNPRAGTVTLTQNPRVVDGEVEIEGHKFVLYRDERRFASIPDPDAPAGQPTRSVVRLGELPDLGFSQEEDGIDVAPQDRMPQPRQDEEEQEREYIDPAEFHREGRGTEDDR